MFVLTRLEGQRGGLGGAPAVSLFLASPVQGVQPGSVGPQASAAPL